MSITPNRRPPPPMLRPARADDCARLTEIALAAKAHWGYPADWLETWRDELTFTPTKLTEWDVWCADLDRMLLGVAALSFDTATGQPAEAEIEALWVWPDAMGHGIGRQLLTHLIAQARAHGTTRLRILSDPNALGFYQRHGAYVVGTMPSTPAGRALPLCYIDCANATRDDLR